MCLCAILDPRKDLKFANWEDVLDVPVSSNVLCAIVDFGCWIHSQDQMQLDEEKKPVRLFPLRSLPAVLDQQNTLDPRGRTVSNATHAPWDDKWLWLKKVVPTLGPLG